MKKYFEPFLGCISSIGVKGANDIQEAVAGINVSPDVMKYFIIGALGALGGLIVKILWGCLKLWIPGLRKIDVKN
jgi:hypothetical protein